MHMPILVLVGWNLGINTKVYNLYNVAMTGQKFLKQSILVAKNSKATFI